MPVCCKCGLKFPFKYRDEKGVIHNFQHRSYCISCSPLHAHNTRKLEDEINESANKRKCLFCERTVGRRRKVCGSCQTKIRKLRIKIKAIKYKGGKCNQCGWSGHPAGFQFHHTGIKAFEIGHHSVRSWNNVVKELDECELLCATCHHIKHSNPTESLLRHIGYIS